MTHPTFHAPREGGLSVAELAAAIGADLVGDGSCRITGVAPLGQAQPCDLVFATSEKYADDLRKTVAGAAVIPAALQEALPAGCIALVCELAHAGFAKAAALLYPQKMPDQGIAPQAYIHPTAQVAENVTMGPFAVVEAGARIASGCSIGAGSYIGQGVSIGEDTVISPNVTVQYATVGRRCLLHPGVRVGQDGFGFAFDGKMVVKVPQLGIVEIEDDVELGANTTVDRGALENTRIGRGCKIDNLVQIAHNVTLGQMCQISGQVGIAGSAHLGNRVILGGQVAINGHLHIADGVQVAGCSGISKTVDKPGEIMGGVPAVPIRDWRRQVAALNRLVKNSKKTSA